MFKQRYGRIKKRNFVVLAICLIAVLIPVLALYLFSAERVESGNIADFSVGDQASRQVVQGLGFDISAIDDGNLVKNNSFEPLVYRQNLLIDSGDDELIKVAMPNDSTIRFFAENFFVNANAEVFATDSEGHRTLKKSGKVSQYLSDQIDDFQPLGLPPDLPQNIRWNCIVESDEKVVLGGTRGYILSIDSFSNTTLSRIPSEAKVIGICVFADYFLALDENGGFYKSSDSLKWELLFRAADQFFPATAEDNLNAESGVSPSTSETVNQETPVSETHHAESEAGETLISKTDDSIISETDKSTGETAADVTDQTEIEAKSSENIKWSGLSSRVDDQGDSLFMAVGENGYVLYGNSEEYHIKQLKNSRNINAVTSNADGFYLVGDNSLAFYSHDGENYRYLDVSQKANWQTVSSLGNQVMIAGDQGQVVFSKDGYSFNSLNNETINKLSLQYSEQSYGDQDIIVIKPRFMSCSILSHDQFVLLDSRGMLFFSDNLGETWKSLDDLAASRFNLVQRLPSGRLIMTGFDGSVEYAIMGLVIKLDSKLEQGEYENGDSLVLEQISALPVIQPKTEESETLSGDWYISNPSAAKIQINHNAPGGGKAALEIDLAQTTDSENTLTGLFSQQTIEQQIPQNSGLIIQQKLDDTAYSSIKNNTIFNFEFWAKSVTDDSTNLNLSFAGLNLQIEQINKTISGDWKKYQGFFVLPKNSIRDDKPLWLQIELNGSGKIYLDNIWFGTADNSGKNVLANLSEDFPKSSILRLNFIQIGSKEYHSESWLSSEKYYTAYYQTKTETKLQGQANLAKSMELCNSFNANPWLVIDSQASDSELKHLMQYLFGQQNTPLGELRTEHGALSRYSDIFNQIYLEIGDQNGIFENDWQRKSYVDWVVQVLSETPEYAQVKKKLIFVDGMQYKDDIILSDADYHASDFNIDYPINNLTDLERFNSDFSELLPRDPGRGKAIRSELIRQTNQNFAEIRLADVIVTALSMMGDEIDATLLNLDLTADSAINPYAHCYGNIGRAISNMNPYTLNSGIEQENIAAYAYGSGNKRIIILINLSEISASCQILNIDLKGFTQTIYDERGTVLEQSEVRHRKSVYSLLPGGIIVLEGMLQKD
ncbi:MAG: hypothetical protein ACOX3H_05310 [Saccharofermentanales bacterium]|jgi:photosystem II stability/assembly factor-like uncharacterized protein